MTAKRKIVVISKILIGLIIAGTLLIFISLIVSIWPVFWNVVAFVAVCPIIGALAGLALRDRSKS